MAAQVVIPQVGNEIEEVTIVAWLVDDGATVRRGQEILEIETDKAVFTVEAPVDGILHRGPFKEGDTVKVLTPVALVGDENDTWSDAPAPVEAAPARPSSPPASQAGERGDGRQGPFASPRARRLAREHGVDLTRVQGSGPQGRILERDVRAALEPAVRATPVARRLAAAEGIDLAAVEGTGPGGRITRADVERARAVASTAPEEDEVWQRVPLRGVRKVIAERMTSSVRTAPQVTLVTEVDATEFVGARERLKAALSEAWGFAPAYLDLLALIVVRALRRFPYINARLREETIEYLRPVHLGIAVDTERGLLVPVIKNAHELTLHQLAQRRRELVEQARAGRIAPQDLRGSTFTITSLGTYDIDAFTPIINPPEAAILGVGRIHEKPAVYRGEIAIRHMWTLSLVFDHRLVDGAPAARFLQHIKAIIEEPYLLLVEG